MGGVSTVSRLNDKPHHSEVERCIALLEALTSDPTAISPEQLVALQVAAGRFSRPNKEEIRLQHKAFYYARRKTLQQADRNARATTGIRAARTTAVFEADGDWDLTVIATNGNALRLDGATDPSVCTRR